MATVPQQNPNQNPIGPRHLQRIVAITNKHDNRIEKLERNSKARALVTSLPTVPYDGQEIIYQADAAHGIEWRFRYNASSVLAYKWEFIGGSFISDVVNTSETAATGGAYQDLATVGPSVTVPFAGVYAVEFGSQNDLTVFTANRIVLTTVKIGGAAASDSNAAWASCTAAGFGGTAVRSQLVTCAASDVLKLMYKVAADTARWQNRWLRVTPQIVG